MSGYKKIVADMKQSGEMCAFEGKQTLSFSTYKLLATDYPHEADSALVILRSPPR